MYNHWDRNGKSGSGGLTAADILAEDADIVSGTATDKAATVKQLTDELRKRAASPAVTVDNVIARFNGVAGDIDNSTARIDDNGKAYFVGTEAGELNISSTGEYPSTLTLEGRGAVYTNSSVVLKALQGTNYRASGVFMYDSGGQNEWFIGRPYTDSDSIQFCRRTGIGDHVDGTSASTRNLFEFTNTGSLVTKDNIQCSRHITAKSLDDVHYGHLECRNLSGQRGAYFGWGNAGSEIDLSLDQATQLNLNGGNFKFTSAVQMTGIGTPFVGAIPTSDASGNLTFKSPLGGTGSQGTRTSNGQYYIGNEVYYRHYMHIRLPLTIDIHNEMYMHRVTGYTYSNSKLIDITYAGYCYKNESALIYGNDNNRNLSVPLHEITDVHQYVGHDNHIYSRFRVTSDAKYMTLASESMRVGNGSLMTEDFQFEFSPFPILNAGTRDAISTGDRSTTITVTASAGLFRAGHDDPSKLVDGNRQHNLFFDGAIDSTNKWIQFDFGSPKSIQAFVMTGSNVSTHGDVVIETSADAATWTDSGTVLLATNEYTTVPSPNSDRYWRFRFVGDTESAYPWLYEMLFETLPFGGM